MSANKSTTGTKKAAVSPKNEEPLSGLAHPDHARQQAVRRSGGTFA